MDETPQMNSGASGSSSAVGRQAGPPTTNLAIAAAWLAVGVPLLWGVAETCSKVLALFRP